MVLGPEHSIGDLKKELASKEMAAALKGSQNAIRHHAVLQFFYYLRNMYVKLAVG